MRETCSPSRLNPAHTSITMTRQDTLADEARRLARRRSTALAVAARCRGLARREIEPEVAQAVSERAMRRATILHVRFHRALDGLVAAGGFDEALAIVRDRRAVAAR